MLLPLLRVHVGMRSLVDVASAPIPSEGAPKAKAKAKTKAKAKAGAHQVVPKIPEEQRAAIRTLA